MNPFFLRARTGLGGKITSFLNRPKVELDFKEEENYVVRNVNDRVLEIRLKIINNGLTTAKRTNVKLESVIQGEMNVLTRDPHENYFKLNISDEDSQNGDYKFIELIKKRGTVKEGRKKIVDTFRDEIFILLPRAAWQQRDSFTNSNANYGISMSKGGKAEIKARDI